MNLFKIIFAAITFNFYEKKSCFYRRYYALCENNYDSIFIDDFSSRKKIIKIPM